MAGLFPHGREDTVEKGHSHIHQQGDVLHHIMVQGAAVEVQWEAFHLMAPEATTKALVGPILQWGLEAGIVAQAAAEAGALILGITRGIPAMIGLLASEYCWKKVLVYFNFFYLTCWSY